MNGNTGTVIATDSASDEDGHGVDVIVDIGGGQDIPVELANPPGVDARPLAGDFAALVDATSDGSKRAVAFFDPRTEPKAGNGEHRVYGRDAQGNTVCEIWCKSNGEIQITNFKPQALTISSQGTVIVKSDIGDVRLNEGGQPIATVGSIVLGSVSMAAIAAAIASGPPYSGIPIAAQVVSGAKAKAS